ncbi:restriction endonuclease subunit S [Shewanella algae]|uniref:restriction endonuclease subunit S n=1 Tax=Shewanella algae TaxID=38313 RepID=UPI003006C161
MVPNGWNTKPLADIVKEKISYGIVQAGPHVPDGIPYIKSSDVRGTINPDALQRTSQEIHFKYRRSSVHPGDIVFSLRGNIGESAIVPASLPEANLTQGTARISVSVEHSNLFHYYQLASEKILNRVNALSKGSTFKEISLEELRKVKVLCAPLPEQKKIAQILSAWDKAITTTEQLLANSQQQKKALMQQLLTGKKRLLDENGVRFSGEWEKGKLSDIANIDSGYAFKSADFTDSEKGIPIIRMSDFKTGGVDISNAAKVIPETTIGLDRFKLKNGDFVFGMSGSLSNYGWIKEQDLPCFLNQRVGRILAKECAVQMFVTYLYLSDKIQQSILDKAAGAAQLNISSTDLRKTIVHYPGFEEQQKIAAVLSTADEEISALQQKLDALKQEKKALMQQLLTGKRRVKIEEVGNA